ncbi:phox-associated domain-containing protein, partial [Tanacetum coccineum]
MLSLLKKHLNLHVLAHLNKSSSNFGVALMESERKARLDSSSSGSFNCRKQVKQLRLLWRILLIKYFVLDMWYSDITLDKEAPQLIHGIVMDNLAEISTRADVADLVGDHSELFRKSQAVICYMRDFNVHFQVPGKYLVFRKMLHNHYLLWRYANAKAQASMEVQRTEMEVAAFLE